ncbi:ribulokinase [Pseudofrankia inefficax]|uniref:Ribulokinase n=1 Tax=Pseudofrankia inefficax (strain DSM 45817 / CECT 9037 / DDB 130130 / EuI1c) TaxID=298654 RepID=E3IY18_PSEI1|nr:ribulokinase [Pseudofrankia inefficax]ADP81473.1 L-ribulokinase [Pseudofrankia inefficax]
MTTTAEPAAADACVVGIDFGTLSGRASVIRVRDGHELATAVHAYPDGVIDTRLPGGRTLPPDWALQNPRDWIAVLATAVPAAVRDAGVDPAQIIGIGTDFTACTVLPTTADGTPLCELPGYGDRPHAWPKLWKHHAAQPHADRINALAHARREPWITRYGGKISSEWQVAKALQVLEEDPEAYAATERWIEAADWIVWQLTGVETRNACTAGYKGILQDGAYPTPGFFAALNPAFADYADTRLSTGLLPLGAPAGRLTERAAGWTGLPAGIVVAAGNVDAHVSAPAVGVTEPGHLLAVMGTSTCHVMSADTLAEVPGMCGVVDGGIIAGRYGYEAGQSGVGDLFAWWTEHHVPGSYRDAARTAGISLHQHLTALTADDPVGAHGLLALDWMNGNRSILVDHTLSGVIVGLTLASRPEHVYRALLEATAFGTRRILEAFRDAGVPVAEFYAAGGLTQNTTLMQLYADVLGYPIHIAATSQAPALGSAIHAAVAAGAYPDVPAAAAVMGRVHRDAYRPDPARHDAYTRLYADYRTLHDYFGAAGTASAGVMRRLRGMRDAARREPAPALASPGTADRREPTTLTGDPR